MVNITIGADTLILDVIGWDKIWSLKGRIEVPLAHVKSARVDPNAARGWWHGLRMPGTQLPGVIIAGSYYKLGRTAFYDVHDPDNTIVIDLDHEHYDQLVVEVENPDDEARRINEAVA